MEGLCRKKGGSRELCTKEKKKLSPGYPTSLVVSVCVVLVMLSHVWLFVIPWTICSPPGSSVHEILQARILEWVAISFCRRSSWPRDWARVSHVPGRFSTIWAIRTERMGKGMCVCVWESALKKYCNMVDLQCCVSFRCTVKWISYTYIHFFVKDVFPI